MFLPHILTLGDTPGKPGSLKCSSLESSSLENARIFLVGCQANELVLAPVLNE